MKSRSLTVLLLLAALFFGFNGGYVLGQSPLAPVQVFQDNSVPETAVTPFKPFWEVYNLIQTQYFDQPVEIDLLVEGAINGMLAVLDDPNTRYLSPQSETAARESMAGEFEGIGAEVSTNEEGQIVIVSPFEGSPAETAGLLPGDILLRADDNDLSGMSAAEAAGLVRGPAGTPVLLLVGRGEEQLEIEVIRDVVQLVTARGEMLDDNIAYVRLSRFGDQSAAELEAVLEELVPQNPAGMILDLRRNPGGGLGTAVDIADQFLPEGTILLERFGNGAEQIYESTDAGLAENIPLVVLIDEGSASASEVLAGAIQDLDRGTIIGQTSFGKGTVQSWRQLSNGGGIRITIARWLTPESTWVHGEGLDPDIQIALPEFEPGETFEDTQLQEAIGFLLGE